MNYGPIIIAEQHNIAYMLGGIQQLRGQEEGEGGSAKSPRLSTRLGPLNVHVDQNLAISESISYYCAQ